MSDLDTIERRISATARERANRLYALRAKELYQYLIEKRLRRHHAIHMIEHTDSLGKVDEVPEDFYEDMLRDVIWEVMHSVENNL